MGESRKKVDCHAGMTITIENTDELMELLQLASEQMKQLEVTLSKIKQFQPETNILKT